MEKIKVAVVDDESLMRDLISTSVARMGYEVKSFSNAEEFISRFEPNSFQLLISDLKMPGKSGVELAEVILQREDTLPILLMTAYGTVDIAVKAMKLGVKDFIEKPFQLEHLEAIIMRLLEFRNLQEENKVLKKKLEKKFDFIGTSQPVKELLGVVADVAKTNSTVLITGESGTGKELIAHAIHYKSNRVGAPFVKINCAAIPEHLIESELFGHEKGAYTGALKTRTGKFEQAHGGTLLLDEIGDMPLLAQVKLLRILQEREVTKVGGNTEVEIDVRVICTTNRNLEKEVEAGNFREDLFYRLNVIPLSMPPLRERNGDIPKLCEYFIAKYNQENGFGVPHILPEALEELEKHHWPGNVRELENIIHRAVIFARYEPIGLSHLRFFKQKQPTKSSSMDAGLTIAEAEKQLILKTLESCGDNRTRAAELLNISVRTLRNKLHEYRIQDHTEPEAF